MSGVASTQGRSAYAFHPLLISTAILGMCVHILLEQGTVLDLRVPSNKYLVIRGLHSLATPDTHTVPCYANGRNAALEQQSKQLNLIKKYYFRLWVFMLGLLSM